MSVDDLAEHCDPKGSKVSTTTGSCAAGFGFFGDPLFDMTKA